MLGMLIASCSDTGTSGGSNSISTTTDKNVITAKWVAEAGASTYKVLLKDKTGKLIESADVSAAAGTTEYSHTFSVGSGEYTVTVETVKMDGKKTETVSPPTVVTTKATAPGAATDLAGAQVTAANDRPNWGVSLTWTAPTDTGTIDAGTLATISKYIIYRKPTEDNVQINMSNYTTKDEVETTSNEVKTTSKKYLSSEMEGKWDVFVLAVNSAGIRSEPSQVATIELPSLATAPSVPGSIQLSPKAKSLLVSWTVPTDLGKNHRGQATPIAGYTVYWKKGTTVSTTDYLGKKDTDSTSITISDLEGKVEYAVIVVAKNTLRSAATTAKTATTLAEGDKSEAPGAVTGVSISEQKGDSMKVSWAAPTSTGLASDGNTAATITGYRIYWKRGDTVSQTDSSHSIDDPGTTSYTITGLDHSTAYSIMLVAKNSAGLLGTAKYASGKTPLQKRAGGTSKITVGSNKKAGIVFTWTAADPEIKDDGTPVPATYHIYWNKGRSVLLSNSKVTLQATAPLTYTLVPPRGDTNYTFALLIDFFSHSRQVSTTVKSVSFAENPEAPKIENSSQSGRDVTLKLSAASAGKDAKGDSTTIASYVLTWKKVKQDQSLELVGTETFDTLPLPSSHTITGLLGNTDYQFELVAKDSESQTSIGTRKVSIGDLEKAPAAPTIKIKGYTANAISVEWSKPDPGKISTGAAASITGYTIYWKKGADVTSSDTAVDISSTHASFSSLSYALSSLTLAANDVYSFIVKAENSAGLSVTSPEVSVTISGASAPAKPTNVKAVLNTGKKTSIDVSWDAVTGATKYHLYWKEKKTGETLSSASDKSATVGETSYSYTVSGLRGATDYEFMVIAANAQRSGTASDVSEATTGSLQKDPGLALVSASDHAHAYVVLTWEAPQTEGLTAEGDPGGAFSYKVELQEGTSTLWTEKIAATQALSYEITGLTKSTAYNIRLTATNLAGSRSVEQSLTTTAKTSIQTWADLTKVSRDLAGDYKLESDLVAPANAKFTPIGGESSSFTGSFDGNGKKITGLSITHTGGYAGLFGKIKGTTAASVVVKDLTLENVTIEALAVVGGLVGYLEEGKIENVSVSGTVEASGELAVQISEKSHSGSHAGGLVGLSKGTISSASSSASVEGNSNNVGGMVGSNSGGSITGYATGNVNGNYNVGGLVGYNSGGSITGYATGNVSGNIDVGGLVGSHSGTIIGYATGNVRGTDSFVGGLVGEVITEDSNVNGYVLGYVSSASSVASTFWPALGSIHPTISVKVFLGRTSTEATAEAGAAGSGDHVGIISKTATSGLKARILGGNDISMTAVTETTSPAQSSFPGLSFYDATTNTAGKWELQSGKKWPTLRLGFASTDPRSKAQDPVIPAKPANFVD